MTPIFTLFASVGILPSADRKSRSPAPQGDGQGVAQASRLRVLAASRRQKRENHRARRPVKLAGEDACATLSTALPGARPHFNFELFFFSGFGSNSPSHRSAELEFGPVRAVCQFLPIGRSALRLARFRTVVVSRCARKCVRPALDFDGGRRLFHDGATDVMGSSRLQHQRYELKYQVSEEKALRIRDFVQGYLEIDEYGALQPNLSYPTLSLYLDSDRLDTYWHAINGNRNRFKLRLRYYDDQPDTPVFFEIKRRDDNVILKERGAVRKSAVRWLLAGHMPERQHMLNPKDTEAFVAVQRFCHLMQSLCARPKMHVAYLREAYENPRDNNVRVTLDRQVGSQPNPNPRLIAKSPRPHLVFGPTVILELKFTARYPKWFRDLVETFHCMQMGAAKYSEGIFARGEDWVHHACRSEALIGEFLSAQDYSGLFEAVSPAKA